jgi:ketosteroid isomerase-like protein
LVFQEDIAYHVPRRSSVAGDYHGQDEALGLFARIFELSGGTYQIELHDAVSNDDHAVALFTASGQREGTILEDRTVLVAHVREGRFAVAHVREGRFAVAHVREGRFAEIWILSEDLYVLDAFFA